MADGSVLETSQLDVSSSSGIKHQLTSDDSELSCTVSSMDPSSLPTSSTGGSENTSEKPDFLPSTPVKKYKKSKNEKYCLVCGDRALGYNFNAVTCESCKAFFRRNALKDQSLKCLFQGQCNIDLRTRRFCPYCRLNKCYQIGMKKEMILDESERKARMQKVSMNRAKKQCKKTYGGEEVVIKEEPTSDMEMESTAGDTDTGKMSPCGTKGEKEPELVPKQDSLNKISQEIIINRSMLPSDPVFYRTLTEEEKKLISDVTMAYKDTLASFAVEQQHLNDKESYSNLNDLVNNSEFAVRKLIKFVKLLGDFKRLSQENQIAVLKSCVLNALLLRSVNFYDVENDAWLTPTGNIPTSVLKQATGFHDLHDAHTSYCRSLKAISQDDEYIMALLQVIIIFKPDGVNIEQRHEVSDLQDKYIILLKHYLESSFSFLHAHTVFSNLLRKFNELQYLGDDHAKIILQVNASQIEPLMLEVLNLH